LQFAQELNYPTLDITIDRERAGQFGLTMADVVRSVVPATLSTRFTQPNYWRDPNSGNAFQIQVQLPQNRMQGVEELGDIPVMQSGRPEPSAAPFAQASPIRSPVNDPGPSFTANASTERSSIPTSSRRSPTASESPPECPPGGSACIQAMRPFRASAIEPSGPAVSIPRM